jgi:hypothetical protein
MYSGIRTSVIRSVYDPLLLTPPTDRPQTVRLGDSSARAAHLLATVDNHRSIIMRFSKPIVTVDHGRRVEGSESLDAVRIIVVYRSLEHCG